MSQKKQTVNFTKELVLKTLRKKTTELKWEEDGDILVWGLRFLEWKVASYCAIALGKMENNRAVPDLLNVAQDPEKDVLVRDDAIFSLAWLDAEECEPALLEILKNPKTGDPNLGDDILKGAVIKAFADIGQRKETGREYLLKTLDEIDPRENAWQHMIFAFYEVGDYMVEMLVNKIEKKDRAYDRAIEIFREAVCVKGNRKVIRALRKVFQYDRVNKRARLKAAEVLGVYGQVQILTEFLQTNDLELRRSIVRGLGFARNKSAVGPLINLYNKETKPEMKEEILFTLVRIEDTSEKVLSFLTERLEDQEISPDTKSDFIIVFLSEAEYSPAIEVLKKIAEDRKNVDLAGTATRELGRLAIRKLDRPERTKLADSLLRRLEKAVDDDSILPYKSRSLESVHGYANEVSTRSILDALGSMGKSLGNNVAQRLISILDSAKIKDSYRKFFFHEERIKILQTLERVGGEEILIRILNEKSRGPETDGRIVYLLGHPAKGQKRRDKTVRFLEKILKDEGRDESVRREAACGLGELRTESSVGPLLGALKSKSTEIKGAASISLSKIKSQKTVGPLLTVLKDEDAQVRANAIAALGFQGEAGVIDPIIKTLETDTEAKVRKKAVLSLLNLRRAVKFSSKQDERIEKELNKIVRNRGESMPLRIEATWAIGKLKYYALSKLLRDIINASTKPNVRYSKALRVTAAGALVKMKDYEYLGILISFLTECARGVHEKSLIRTIRTLGEAYPHDAYQRRRIIKKLVRILIREVKIRKVREIYDSQIPRTIRHLGGKWDEKKIFRTWTSDFLKVREEYE